ncbi:proteoglycan 4-like [Palaemon carinicauda]|uniref:proteoglycan 4-like n=1 Tax=Palaemon carinicauda TaxID=392227 RepID=UPI0035B58836
MADRGSSPIPTSSPRTRVNKGRIKKPRGLTSRSHAKHPTPPATEPVPGTSRHHPMKTLDHLPATQDEAETESIPSQDPPSQTEATGDSKFRLTPGPSITSYAAIVAMEASNPRLNMTIRPNRRGQLVMTAKDEQTKTNLEQQDNVLKLDINERPTTIIVVYDLDQPLEPVLQHPAIITVKRCEGKAGGRSHKLEAVHRGARPPHLSFGLWGTFRTEEHTIPEPSSPPTPPPAYKPERPAKPPSKEKRSPTHTPCTPSPLKLTSPNNSPNVSKPKQPEPNPSSSAPTTHTPNIFHSLKEFPNLPSTATIKSSASRPSKEPFNRDISEYDLSACPMGAL